MCCDGRLVYKREAYGFGTRHAMPCLRGLADDQRRGRHLNNGCGGLWRWSLAWKEGVVIRGCSGRRCGNRGVGIDPQPE